MKELKDLVEGDEVLVTGMYHRHIAKVDKVTKTQIIVNNARFKRDSGWQCGSDRWNVRQISMDSYKNEMNGIYSSSVCEETIDEAPMAYKSTEEIVELIKPTVDVIDVIKPIYNFKAKL